MSRRAKWIVWLSVVALAVTAGCGSHRELNDLAVVTAMGVDEREGKLEISLQIVNPTGGSAQMGGESGGSGGGGGAVYTYMATGKTLLEAIGHARNMVPRELLFSHLFYIAIGEQFARERGFDELLDAFSRYHEIRGNVLIFVAKKALAKDILSIYTPIEKNPGMELRNHIEVSGGSFGLIQGIRLRDVTKWRFGERHGVVILGVEPGTHVREAETTKELEHIVGNRNSFQLRGLALFRNDRLIDWLTIEETLGWVLIKNLLKGKMFLRVPCAEYKRSFGILLKGAKTNVTPVVANGRLHYRIKVKGTAVLNEMACPMSVDDPKTIERLQRETEQLLERNMLQAIKRAKRNRIDIFGFGEKLYRKHPEEWKKRRKKWQKDFADLDVRPDVHIQIETTGLMIQSVYEE